MPYKDPEAAKRNKAQYRAINRERILAEKRGYYSMNSDKLKDVQREYRKTHSDTTGAIRQKRYRENHPERVTQDNHTRKARRLSVSSVPFTDVEMLTLYGTDCHICLEPVDLLAPRRVGLPGWERGLHRDHVLALALGGADIIENSRPAHGICNLRKSARE